jgi:hypothetical protein
MTNNIVYKITREQAQLEAKWIDKEVRKLLPRWVVRIAPKLRNNYIFTYLVKKWFGIEIITEIYPFIDSFDTKKVITIKQFGKYITRATIRLKAR